MRLTPPGESYPRCLEWVWDPGWMTGHPEKLGPAAALAPRPPHARPGRPRLREPSLRPASHSPLTLARATEPGSGNPRGCRMPSGSARRGDQCRATAGRDKQQRTRRRPECSSFPAAAETRPEPKESLAERGVAPRGRRGRVPAQGVRPFPRESAPHRRGTDRALLQMLSYLGLVARRVTGPQEKREPNEGLLATTGHTSELRSAVPLSLSPRLVGRNLLEAVAGMCTPHWRIPNSSGK